MKKGTFLWCPSDLTLLHDALSDGVHELSDSECLELAAAIRTILTALAERITDALKDEAEMREALGTLFRRKKNCVRTVMN